MNGAKNNVFSGRGAATDISPWRKPAQAMGIGDDYEEPRQGRKNGGPQSDASYAPAVAACLSISTHCLRSGLNSVAATRLAEWRV